MSRPCLCSSALTPRRSAVKKVVVTSRQILDRLNKSWVLNVALRVEAESTDAFVYPVVANCTCPC